MKNLAALSLVAFSAFAAAQEPSRAYVTAGAGSAFTLGAGYSLTPHWALEGGFASFGQVAKSETYSGNTRTNTTTDATGIGVKVVYTMRVYGGFSALGSVGAYQVNSSRVVDTYVKPPLHMAYSKSASVSENSSEIAPAFGVGVGYAFSPWSTLRATSERVNDINALTVSLVARF